MPRDKGRTLASALGLGAILAAFAVGCQGSPSTLAPASPGAARIADLTWQVFWIALVVFVVVEGLLLFVILRFRSRGDGATPRQVHGHTKLEVAWTAAPGLVLIGVLVLTFQTMAAAIQIPEDSLRVQVIGHRWWWEVRYPELDITTANEIHVPVGRSVRLDLQSVDVIHSFWVPELGGKTDLIPGRDNQGWFLAQTPGVYRGQCAEFCGVQHANMGFLVVAEPQEQFDAWVRNQQSAAVSPTGDLARAGEGAFIASGCNACHAIEGTRAQGVIGPNLTHMGSRLSIAANTLENTPENMACWLSDPQEVKPGNLMRTPALSAETVRQLTAYLEELK